jgi:hypothetical protein
MLRGAIARIGLTCGLPMALACASLGDAIGQVLDPKVTLSGFIDTVTTSATNVFDTNFARDDDSAWTTRNRARFRLTADVVPLQIQAVLELEIDFIWGQVGTALDAPSGFGLGGEFALNSDLTGVTEIKNIYVEFPVPTPAWIPFTIARFGGQPFRTTLKRSVLATGDYGGVSLESEICGVWVVSILCDDARLAFTYAQIEESLTGGRNRPPTVDRGDDFFTFLSLTYPIPVDRRAVRFIPRLFWGYLDAEGATARAARCRIACAGLPLNGSDPPGTQLPAGTPASTSGNYRPGSNESRHYLGLDQDIELELGRTGKIHINPTVIYMRSRADVYGRPGVPAPAPCTSDPDLRCPSGPRQTSRVQSWLVDLRAGWFCYSRCLDETRLGDLVRIGDGIHLEGLVMWTPGDASHHNLFRKNRVYHPITTDFDYLNGWNEILATGSVDYLTGNAHGMGENVGLGQYGRRQLGTRLTWDVWRYWDQSLSLRTTWSWVWTDQKVDTDAGSPEPGGGTGSYGNIPCAVLEANCRANNNRRGDSRSVGTEGSVGLTYQFNRNLVFDVVGAYLFAGSALDSTTRQSDGSLVKRPAKDAQLVSARLRFRF